MDDPNITMEEYIRLEEEKARKHGKVFNWETAKYGKIWYDEDIQDLRSIEDEFLVVAFNDGGSYKTLSCEPMVSSLNDEFDFRILFDDSDDEDYTNEFPAIVYNDAQTSKSDLLTKPILNPQHIDEFDLNDETSLSEYDEEEQNALYFNDLFPFNIIHPDDLKSKKDNGDNEIDIIQSSGGMIAEAKQIDAIRNFEQEANEPLHLAWERFNDSLYNCPEHKINEYEQLQIFYQGLDTETRWNVDFKGPIPRMTPAPGIEAIIELSKHSLFCINIPFIEALEQMPKYAKFMKDLLTQKGRGNEASKIILNERCSAVVLNEIPLKEKDPESFTIPCVIGQSRINKALADLRAIISLMSYSMFLRLNLDELKPTRMCIELANKSTQIPKGIAENVIVKIDSPWVSPMHMVPKKEESQLLLTMITNLFQLAPSLGGGYALTTENSMMPQERITFLS
ncbi:putative reverse transcriptase domain-containing protein [Tanacetum coccineum]